MREIPLRSLVTGYAACFAVFIVYASAATIVEAYRGGGQQPVVTLALAGIEILAAVAFMLRAARRIAATVLLLVFAIAAVLTAAGGQVPASLVFYAVTTVLIVLLDRPQASQRAVA